MNNLLVFSLIFLLALPLASAGFINETIVLDDSGTAYIQGTTDLDILSVIDLEDGQIKGSTQELTNKNGLLWTFSYETKNPIDYIVSIALPEFAEVQKVTSDAKTTYSVYDNRAVIKFEAKNEPMNIEIGYVTASQDKNTDSTSELIISFLILILIIAVYLLRSKIKLPQKKNSLNQEKLNAVKLTLNENQLKILEALIANNGEASQNKLKHMTGVPKSSLSRNLELMAQRSVISKFYNGTTNHIKIHPSLYNQ